MAKIVDIPQTPSTVNCDANGLASIKFDVNNLKAAQLRVGAKVVTQTPEQQAWFKIDGKSEKSLNPNASDSFLVTINAKSAAPGTYKIKFLVYSVENADEDYTESETIAVTVPAHDSPTAKPSSNMWIVWLLAGLLVVSLVGAGVFFLIKSKQTDKKESEIPVVKTETTPPTEEKTVAILADVKGKSLAEAKVVLEQLGLNSVTTSSKFDVSVAKDTVLDQTPAAGTKVEPSKTDVNLIVADSKTTIPTGLIDTTLQGTTEKLTKLGFNNIKTEKKYFKEKQADIILEVNPNEGTEVDAAKEVVLTVSYPGTKVPDLSGQTLTDALAQLKNTNFKLGKVTPQDDPNKAENIVIGQTPTANELKDEPNTEVALVVSKKPGVKFLHGHALEAIIKSGVIYSPRLIRQLESADKKPAQK